MSKQTKITKAQESVFKGDFARFDVNKNNALDGDELQAMAKFQLGGDAPQDKLDALIAEMDLNADGKVELNEYMEAILGKGWVTIRDDEEIAGAEGSDIKVGRTYCDMKDMVDVAFSVYDDMKKIPLICAKHDEKAAAIGTFWQYASGTTNLNCKALVGLAMNEGKPAAWERIATAASGAMKAGTGNTLVLDCINGAPDIVGIAKETGTDATLAMLFEATKDKPSDAKAAFPALDVGLGDCRADFRVVILSQFLEEDIEDFFAYGQIPLEKCQMVVVNDD